MGSLCIVATPIGNLKDITLRALEVLKSVDLILCEDTRVTKKLLDHYNIKTSTLSYHQHSTLKKTEHILDLLKSGKNLALVSDAGTPAVSDPGNKLVDRLIKDQLIKDQITITSVPGPSAVSAAASISGFPMDKFIFLGYPPTKRKRKKFFQEIAGSRYPVVFYESPHRIIKTLGELEALAGGERLAVVARELTKKFESIYRGTIGEILLATKNDPIRGEYTVVIAACPK